MKFLLENHLKKTGQWLRFLGQEVIILEKALTQETIERYRDHTFVLTSRKFQPYLRANNIEFVVVPLTDWQDQLALLIRRYKLPTELELSLCPTCGSQVCNVDIQTVRNRIPPESLKHIDKATLCLRCDKIYWIGSHPHRMKNQLEKILKKTSGVSHASLS